MSSAVADLFINGSMLESKAKKTVVNPADIEEVIGEVGMAENEDVKSAINSATEAFKTWPNVSIEQKSDMARKAAEKLKPRIEELTSLFVRESGKTLIEAKIDIQRSIQVIEETPDALEDWYKEQDLSNEVQKVKLLRRPRGVTAIITPWNSPVILTIKRVIPAILSGNTVVVKPATNCPLTISHFLEALAESFPPGVVNIVTGSGQKVGNVLATDPQIKTISFVGGTDTGKEIMELSSSTLKKLHLELGGNDPAIILDDALLDDENITKIKNGILRNAGQVCSAIKRIYVHHTKYDELIKKLSASFSRVIVGEGIHPETTMGSMNNRNQLTYVQELIEDSIKNGAKVEHFGIKLNKEKWDKGNFMLPTIVTNVTQNSRIVQEEQFGPVIPILKFTNESEVIEQANDTVYGLRASIWTEDIDRALEMSKSIEAGAVFHNNHTVFSDLRLDFPGVKESGIGIETLHNGFEHFTDSYGFAN